MEKITGISYNYEQYILLTILVFLYRKIDFGV